MKQKKFLSMIIVFAMIFSLFPGVQTAWAADDEGPVAPTPTITANTSVLYLGEDGGQTITLTLTFESFITNPSSALIFKINDLVAADAFTGSCSTSQKYILTVKNDKLNAGDKISIQFLKAGLSKNAEDTNEIKLNVLAGRSLEIDDTSLTGTKVNSSYQHQFTATGGVGKLTYSVSNGAFPAGLTLTSSGLLSGIPTETGSFPFEITATDSGATPQTSTASYTLVVSDPPVYAFSNHTITGYLGDGGDITIPSKIDGEEVTAIGSDAFKNNTAITSVVIPDSVTSIGDNAFYECTKLKSAVLPAKLTEIPNYLFYNCNALVSVNIPDKVTVIGCNSFYYCISLKRVSLPANLIEIRSAAFYHCKSLKNIVIPSSVTKIESSVFQFESGSQLTRMVFLGAAPAISSETIQKPADGFKICYPATENYSGTPWSSFTTVAYDASSTYKLSYDANGAAGTIPAEAADLKVGAYVTLPGQGALTKANCTFAGWNTAADGSGEKYSAGDEFLICSGSVTLYAQWDEHFSITVDPQIAGGTVSTEYKTAKKGDTVTVIVSPDTNYHLKLQSLVYSDGKNSYPIWDEKKLPIDLEESSKAESSTSVEAYGFSMPAANVTITAEFEEGDYGFYEPTGTILAYYGNGGNVVIPSQINGIPVSGIGYDAFASTKSLKTVIIPESVGMIGANAFAGCGNLVAVTFPSSLGSIGDYSFSNCGDLFMIKIPKNVSYLGTGAFSECENLSYARFEGNAPTSLGSEIFKDTSEKFQILYNPGKTGFDAANLSAYTTALIAPVSDEVSIKSELGQLGLIYSREDETASALKTNLYLLPYGIKFGSDITWSSDNTAVISNTGQVTRPSYTGTDATVTLTATATNNGFSGSRSFTVTVLKKTLAESTHTVRFNLAGGTQTSGGALTQTVIEGDVVVAPIATRSGYTFKGWNRDITKITSNMTITAQWTSDTVSGGGGNGGGGSSPVPQPAKPDTTLSGNTVTATLNASATVDEKGKAIAAVTQAQMSDAVNQALEKAKAQTNPASAMVEIQVGSAKNAKSIETDIPKDALHAITGSKADGLTVSTPIGALTFDKESLKTIDSKATGDIKVTAGRVETSTLTETEKQLVGDRPVYSFTVTSDGKTISEFGGNVTVSLPYTLKAGENANAIVVYYVDASGALQNMKGNYDAKTGTVTFVTNHFSKYMIGYNKVSFSDVADNAWYSNAITFISARDITTGTGNGAFSPNAKLTRGQFLVMVMKAYGISADTSIGDNFADAGNTYYTGYLAAAKKLGITAGIGNNKYAPEKEITRQEMFTLLYNTLNQIHQLPTASAGTDLTAYSDADGVASWAKDAVTLFVGSGTISGSNGKLNPTDTTNRAQMAQVLCNLITK